MLKPLIFLSSDASLYRDSFDMMHWYSWTLYRFISIYHHYGDVIIVFNETVIVLK